MTTKELIKKEIDKIPDNHLDELLKLIKEFEMRAKLDQKTGLLAKLKNIKIEGPKDFSENIDKYLSGEIGAE